jgi:hypothetical protein
MAVVCDARTNPIAVSKRSTAERREMLATKTSEDPRDDTFESLIPPPTTIARERVLDKCFAVEMLPRKEVRMRTQEAATKVSH